MLRLLTIAVAAFVALTLAAMIAISATSDAPRAAARAPGQADAPAGDPGAPTAPLVVLPPPAEPAAPAPYVPPPGVQIEALGPPPPVSRRPEERAEQLVAFREARRSTAMDQLNAREALRRQRLGLPPPLPAPTGARPVPRARRPGPHQEQPTP